MQAADRITLTLSPPLVLARVATLVAGGLGGRLELPVDRIDDLQLAISTVLAKADGEAEVTVEFDPDDRGVTCRVGPVGTDVEAVLPMVSRLVSDARSDARDGSPWVTMRLDLPERRPGGAPTPEHTRQA